MAARHRTPTKHLFKDYTGFRPDPPSRWTMLRYAGMDRRHNRLWWCRCDCGTERVVVGTKVARGESLSCGCINREITSKRSRTHGMTDTSEYKAWRSMLGRCFCQTNNKFPDYGGRGIAPCRRMASSFEYFYRIMGLKPFRGASLDRIKNDLGYWCGKCKECRENKWQPNCRWTDSVGQGGNRRGVKLLTFNGETLPQAEWARRQGISAGTITIRLKTGWTVEQALSIPANGSRGVGPAAYLQGQRQKGRRPPRKKQPPRTHGMRNTSEYKSWRSMKMRCHCPTVDIYQRYGAKGIVVCLGMRDSFQKFFDILGKRPFPGATVDRIERKRGYDCGDCDNCRARGVPCNIAWADCGTQARHRSNNHMLTFNGETMCMAEWARQVGLPAPTLSLRIKLGWSVELALTTPRRNA